MNLKKLIPYATETGLKSKDFIKELIPYLLKDAGIDIPDDES